MKQDPSNLASRDLSTYDYVKNEKKVDGAFLLHLETSMRSPDCIPC